MAVTQKQIKKEALDLKLIECNRQPGNLKISRQACVRRYILAQNQYMQGPKGHFGVSFRMGLEKCRTCPKGRAYSKRIRKKTDAKTP